MHPDIIDRTDMSIGRKLREQAAAREMEAAFLQTGRIAVSNFEGADAVTGASIDVGHFMYSWDCTDVAGKPVKPGVYTVKVEVAHWPSMRYQLAETTIAVGKKEATSRVEEGDYIPSLVVTYYPK
jgi:hypothetical protein